MTGKSIIRFLFLFLCSSQVHCQQADAPIQSTQARSPVILLPGYKIQNVKGLDNHGGRIWKAGGFVIDFDFGMYDGNAAELVKPQDVLWKREQVINNQKLQCVYTQSHELIVSFHPSLTANFSAKIHNRQELTDVLLMAVTFNAQGYPVDPAVLAPFPTKPK